MSVILKLGDRWARKQEELSETATKLAQRDSELDALRRDQEATLQANVELRLQLRVQEERNSQLSSSHRDLETKFAELDARLKSAQAENAQLCDNNNRLTSELSCSKETVEDLRRRLEEAGKLQTRMQEELNETEKVSTERERQIEDLRRQLAAAKYELEVEKKAKEQKDRHLALMIREKEKLWRQLEESDPKKKKKSEKAKEPAPVSKKVDAITRVLGAVAGNEMEGEMKRYAKVIERMSHKIEEKDAEIAKLGKENYALLNRVRNMPKKV